MSKYVIDEQTLITIANAYKRGRSPDIFLTDNKLTPQPILYIDYVDNGTSEELYSPGTGSLIEYGYEKNNEGILTPVAYSNEDHVKKYFYLGKANLPGIPGTFDQWQKIETDSYRVGFHSWEINKCYVYTEPFMLSLDFNNLESDLNSLLAAPFENPVEVAIPSIALNTTTGKITSTTTQEEGYCKGGTQTETLSLPIMEIAQNPIIPTTSEQKVVSAGYFVTENLKVAPIPSAWVKPSNTITTTSKTLEGRTAESVKIPGGSYVKNDYTISSKYTPNITSTNGSLGFTSNGTRTTEIATGKFTSFRLVVEPGMQGDDPLDVGQFIVIAGSKTVTFNFESGYIAELILVNGNTLLCTVYSSLSSIKSYKIDNLSRSDLRSNISISVKTKTNWTNLSGSFPPPYSFNGLS